MTTALTATTSASIAGRDNGSTGNGVRPARLAAQDNASAVAAENRPAHYLIERGHHSIFTRRRESTAVRAETPEAPANDTAATLPRGQRAGRERAWTEARAFALGSEHGAGSGSAPVIGGYFETLTEVASARDLLGLLAPCDDTSVNVIFADLQGLGGIGRAFATLRSIREVYSRCLVVLTVPSSSAHDFDTYRLPICDVTLAMPFDEDELEIAMLAAARNNLIWNARLSDLRQAQG